MRIKIDGKLFSFFNDVAIQLSLDSIASSFSLVCRFNPDNPDHREIFKPLSYKRIEIFDGTSEIVLTGIIVSHEFNASSSPELIKISGYSLGGVLEDVTIPQSAYPLESLKRSLKEITEKLIHIFGLKLVIYESVKKDANLIYDKSVAEPSETIKSYLAKLTAQRNIVLSHDAQGNIILFRPNVLARPSFFFNEQNTINVSLSINGQALHSEISVIRQPSVNNKNISPVDTIQNTMIGRRRTLVKVLNSGTDTDTANAASNTLAGQLKNIAIKVTIHNILNIKPGQIVEVQSPRAYLYSRTRLMVQSVNIKQNNESETMDLSLVLPETYNGSAPKNIFL